MSENREKMPEFRPGNCARPSLEAVMALQKMLEDGLLDQLDESNEAPPPEVRPAMDRARRTRLADAVQDASRAIRCFFRNLAHKFHWTPGRKEPIGGKSASGNG